VVGDAVVGDAAVGDAVVIDIADPRAVPMTVNPLEPGPGQQVQAHGIRTEPGWLEVVLSWPHRIVVPAADPDVGRTATG
jgi:hypothetical protein